jgi:hypothetical protein
MIFRSAELPSEQYAERESASYTAPFEGTYIVVTDG